jgi:type IV pilus assembly protein PilQ
VNLHYLLFLVLVILGCSSGQGRLEASSDPVLPEGTSVDAPATAEEPAESAEASEYAQPDHPATADGRDAAPPSPETTARADAPIVSEEEPVEPLPPETEHDPAEPPVAMDQETAREEETQALPEDETWEEDGIREEFGQGYTKVVFSGILSEEGYKYSFLDDPPRLVVDVKQPTREVWFNRLPLRGAAFERVRVGRHPDKIRFVLDLREEGNPEPLVESIDTDVVVLAGVLPERDDLPDAIEAPETPQEPDAQADPVPALEMANAADTLQESDAEPVPMGGPEVPLTVAQAEVKPVRVTGIDFEQTDSTSDVVISADGPVPFDVQEKEDAIVVVLPGAQVPEHLQRLIDTKAFPSAILAVQPEQVGAGATGKVTFTIRLREKRPYNVLEEQGGVRVSVLLPETPPAIPLLPPPALPETEGLATAEPEPTVEPDPVAEAEPSVEPEPAEEPMEVKAPERPAPRPAPPVKPARKVSLPSKTQLQPKNYRGQKISLDFKDADIQNVLRLIAEVSNKNIVISEAVKGKVTIRLLNVPWDMALDVILKTYALEKEELGPNILRVAPYSQLKKEREDALRAEEALEKVEALETRVIPVNYAKAKDLKSMLGDLRSKRQDASILVDARTNALILRDLPVHISDMVALIRSLDTPTPQVLIEAKIVELDVNFEQELGIQWGTLYQAGPATGNPTGLNFPNTASVGGVVDNVTGEVVPGITNPAVNLPAAVDSSAGGALGFSLASITNSFQLEAQLSALEKRNHARVLSSPRVATLSNQEARINQGQEVPYQTTSDEGTKTEFKEAVLQLSVTPQITFDRSIIMNILVTNDTPIRDPTVGFIIGTKEARTTVLVKDGDTAVIGGIYTNNDAETLGGVPYLMDLPVAGSLFKKKGETNRRTELIIFITPRIIPSELIQVNDWTEPEEQE